MLLADRERQRREHVVLYAQFATAMERLYDLLKPGLRDLAAVPGQFYVDLQTGFPEAWNAMMDHMQSYSAPQQQLLNDGIRSWIFRSDISI